MQSFKIFLMAMTLVFFPNLGFNAPLIENGDFENGMPKGLVLNNASIIEGSGSGGLKALRLQGKNSMARINGIKTIPGQRYKLSYQAKAGSGTVSDNGYQTFRVFVAWQGAEQKNGMEWQDSFPDRFQNKELVFTAPRCDKPMTVSCELKDDGSLILDDFKLEELPPEKRSDVNITILKPATRNIIYSSDPIDEIVGRLTVSAQTASAEIVLSIQNSGIIVFTRKFAGIKDSFDFSIPVVNLKNGKYILSAAAFTEDGKILHRAEIPVWKIKKSPMEVICKDDLNCYVNGNVFYPVVFWRSLISATASRDDLRLAFYHARKNGVNTFFVDKGEFKNNLKMLDAAKEFDCKIMLHIGCPKSLEKEFLTKWKHNVLNSIRAEVTAHEALLGYFLVDEPMWNGIPLENILTAYDFLREIDPYRPIWINEAPRGAIDNLKEYSRAADIWGIDIYPIPAPNSHSALEDRGITSVGKYTQIAKASAEGRKPVWMVLQGTSWGAFLNRNPRIYPDEQQLDFMAFDCLVNGAQSICYWGIIFIDDPAFLKKLFSTTRKLAALSGILTRPSLPDETVKCSDSSVKFLVKSDGGKFYIIAVNERNKNIDVSFEGSFNSSSVNVIFENRKLDSSSGIFRDSFIPYGSHVYASGDLPAPVIKTIPDDPAMDKTVSPFDTHAIGRINASRYRGSAQWIWLPGKNHEPGSMAAFQKEFTLDSLPSKAEILITADDNYLLYINGSKIGTDQGDGWNIAEVYDIKPFLKDGRNTVYVEAADSGNPPCGLLADISILDAKGNKRNIYSDSSWQAKELKEFSKSCPFVFTGIDSAKIADFGQGAWGPSLEFRKVR